MAYAELPGDLWAEILSLTSVPAAVNFLATNRELRAELLPELEAQIATAKEQHRLAAGRTAVEAWLVEKAQQIYRTRAGQGGWEHQVFTAVTPAFSALLSPSFPRREVAGQSLAVMNPHLAVPWFRLYILMNQLEVTPLTFRVDANLATLSGYPEGSVQLYTRPGRELYYNLKDIFQRNRVADITLTPEELERMKFILDYMNIELTVLPRPPARTALGRIDPTGEFLKLVRLTSPRGV